ncbi:acylphosphatase [Alkalihalobacillus sp. NPDC078783]
MKKRTHCHINGRVQGVGFRYFAQELAVNNHLVGWVQNNDDGTVELEAEGEEKEIKSFLLALKKGNRFASVLTIQDRDMNVTEREKSFKISY